jgi:hypothetical protein
MRETVRWKNKRMNLNVTLNMNQQVTGMSKIAKSVFGPTFWIHLSPNNAYKHNSQPVILISPSFSRDSCCIFKIYIFLNVLTCLKLLLGVLDALSRLSQNRSKSMARPLRPLRDSKRFYNLLMYLPHTVSSLIWLVWSRVGSVIKHNDEWLIEYPSYLVAAQSNIFKVDYLDEDLVEGNWEFGCVVESRRYYAM